MVALLDFKLITSVSIIHGTCILSLFGNSIETFPSVVDTDYRVFDGDGGRCLPTVYNTFCHDLGRNRCNGVNVLPNPFV